MTNYYKYEFISPEPLWARVKEELKSHFDTGAVDDVLFPIWTDDCLKKLGRATHPLIEAVAAVDNFQVSLPEDFHAMREAWLCVSAETEAASPTSVYWVEQEETRPMDEGYAIDSSIPEKISVVMKKSRTLVAAYAKKYLLRPGSVKTMQHCSQDCRNYGSLAPDTFDITGRTMALNFREGTVYFLYYSNGVDACDNQVIPDNFRIKDYILKYLTYRVWKSLADNATDEGQMNRYDRKAQEAQQASDLAQIEAFTEIKKETVHQKAERLKRQNTRLNRFNIP